MNACPHCGRRLLSRASSRCNWCGREIEDAAYQAQAEVEREAFFAHQAEHDAQSLANLHAMSTELLDPLGTPLGPGFGRSPRRALTEEARLRNQARRLEGQARVLQQKAEAAQRQSVAPRSERGFPLPDAPPRAARASEPTSDSSPSEEAPETPGQRFQHLEL